MHFRSRESHSDIASEEAARPCSHIVKWFPDVSLLSKSKSVHSQSALSCTLKQRNNIITGYCTFPPVLKRNIAVLETGVWDSRYPVPPFQTREAGNNKKAGICVERCPSSLFAPSSGGVQKAHLKLNLMARLLLSGPFSVPTAPPQDVEAKALDSTTVKFTWNPPPQQFINGINQGYKVRGSSGIIDPSTFVASMFIIGLEFRTGLRNSNPFCLTCLN